MTMTKRELTHVFAEKLQATKEDADTILNLAFGIVREALLRGRDVKLDGLGTLKLKFRPGGDMNNNITGKVYSVGPRVKVRFKPFPTLQKQLNEDLAPKLAEFTEDDDGSW